MSTFPAQQDALEAFERSVPDFLRDARTLARQLLTHRDYVTVDDIRARMTLPATVDSRVMGSVFKTRDFEACGFERSTRKECHHRPVTRFRLRGNHS